MQQMSFSFPFGHGGFREGSGRKKRKEGVSHGKRERVTRHQPVLVTWKLKDGLRCLRRVDEAGVIMKAIKAAHRSCFRVVHFTIQNDHLHMLVEGDDAELLGKGMCGLGTRIGKGLNKLWGRRGKVLERYHSRVLKSPREVWIALRYVLNNFRKHGCAPSPFVADEFSSGAYFNGWSDRAPGEDPGICAKAESWLLRVGWRERHSLIPFDSIPGR